MRRVLTNNAKEFRASFVTICVAHAVQHTKTEPSHAWTDRLVERPQGAILPEHWRVRLRRYYFTSARALQRSFDRNRTSWPPPSPTDSGLAPQMCRGCLEGNAGLTRKGPGAERT